VEILLLSTAVFQSTVFRGLILMIKQRLTSEGLSRGWHKEHGIIFQHAFISLLLIITVFFHVPH
jgi:hypothetical protein